MVARNADVIKNAFKTGCKAGDGTPLYVIKAKYNSLEIPGVLNPSLAFRRSPGSFPSALISWGFKAHEVKDYEVLLNKNGGLGWKQMKNGHVPPGAIVISKEQGYSIYSVKGTVVIFWESYFFLSHYYISSKY